MKICYDVSQTGALKAGCGYFAHGLISTLADIGTANNYVLCPAVGDLFWDPDCATATFDSPLENFRRLPAPRNFAESIEFWSDPPADFEARLDNPDIFHANNFFCPGSFARARVVYTLYDLSFLVNPEWTTEANRVGCFSGVFQASMSADFVVAISESSQRHFNQVFPHYPAERMGVVYPASRFSGRRAAPRPARLARFKPGGFWLSVATLEPRKNHRRLIEAYALHRRESGSAMPLVLAGGSGWMMESFRNEVGEGVELTGYLQDAELQWLYENCYAFVYPSLFEGFGMPVLEAMDLGAAVICSRATSLPEIVGDAGLLVDPTDAGAIAAAMRALVCGQHDRERLRTLAAERARRFSWRDSARRMLDIYKATLERPHFQ